MSLGGQVLSTKTTEPRTTFGTSGRTERTSEKTFEFKRLGTTSPGFSSTMPSGFGSQNTSNNMSFPSVRFGHRYASDIDMVKENRPGPGEYHSTQAVGKQALSARASAPEYRVGTGSRFAHYKNVFKDDFQTPAAQAWAPAAGWLGDSPQFSFHGRSRRSDIANGLPAQKPTCSTSPGPGSYESTVAIGPQPESLKTTMPRLRVGTSTRDKSMHVFVSKEHERESTGKHSPGPSAYFPAVQMSSRNKASSSWKFGSGDRFSEVKSGNGRNLKVWSPGPGTYVV